MNKIFARRIELFTKSGTRVTYTHVTKFEVSPSTNKEITMPILFINGEIDDVDGSRIYIEEQFPVSDIEFTLIDWYVPFE
jgi:hypothetical protein